MVGGLGSRYAGSVAIIEWNGADLPDGLRSLPAGTYVLQRADDALTPDEDEGLRAALESIRTGSGVAHDEVRQRLLGSARR